jgi:UDP-glucose 4-epimerase
VRILLTGASGFVGRSLADALVAAGFDVRGAYRARPRHQPAKVEPFIIGDLSSDTDWRAALRGVDVVVHLAGPAHARFREEELQRAIVGGASSLALQAAGAGVCRFIYVSSIKAVAAGSSGTPIREMDIPQPTDAYGRAKADAERTVASVSALCSVVLRPPLVHAADAKANFGALLRLASLPAPLPLGCIGNKRSLLSRRSLVAAVTAVLRSPSGPSGVFHLADRPSLSTTQIVAALRRGMGRPEQLFACPALHPILPRVLFADSDVDDALFRTHYGYGDCTSASSIALIEETGREWMRRA